MQRHRHPITTAHFERTTEAAATDIRVEAAPSDFEVQRAIDGYIPLLKACYRKAHKQEPAIPTGYEVIGEIRADAGELQPEAGDPPEVREAVRNDVESAEAGLADPAAFGFVVRETGTPNVLVAIRGTQTPREWMANFTAVPNPFSLAPGFGLVHLGFERMERSVRATIRRALEAVDTGARITVIGHSLGGAMGILAAVDIKRNMSKSNVDVCTFGGPRVGKFIFRHRFNQEIPRSYRVTNQGDIVPHVPPLVTGWAHVGEEIEVDGNLENPHGLDPYLEGLRNLGTVRELAAPGAGAEAAITGVLSVRVP